MATERKDGYIGPSWLDLIKLTWMRRKLGSDYQLVSEVPIDSNGNLVKKIAYILIKRIGNQKTT